jgi:hypothetical protein
MTGDLDGPQNRGVVLQATEGAETSRAADGAEPIIFSAFCGPGYFNLLCFLRPWSFSAPSAANLEPSGPVERINENGGSMSFLSKLLGKNETPKQRVQVCVECGMPVADHKEWCSILQGQNELKLKAEKKSA